MDVLRISNAQRKFLQGLKLKKNRLKYGLFLAEGSKVVGEILNYKNLVIKEIYALSSWIEAQSAGGKLTEYRCYTLAKKDIDRISNLKSPDGVVALCQIPEDQSLLNAERILFLDRVNNPGNLGTILRAADWYGVQQIVISHDSVDAYNPKVVQSAKGSIGRLPLCIMSLPEAHKVWSKLPVYHSTLSGEPLHSLQINRSSWILAIGSESHGLSQDSLGVNGQGVKISKQTDSPIDSLNVAVATGILLAEFSRQQTLE